MSTTRPKAGRSGIERSSCLAISTPPLQLRRRRLMWFGGGLGIHGREARRRVRRCLGDNCYCHSSGLYGSVGSGQVRLGGVSGECGLVRFSCGLWNDRENDQLSEQRLDLPAWMPRRSADLVVVTGNEDGAHHVSASSPGALIDIGFTIPGQAWTYCNKGPGRGRPTSRPTRAMSGRPPPARRRGNLVAVARALQATAMPAPPAKAKQALVVRAQF
jgi:hypothetical protein